MVQQACNKLYAAVLVTFERVLCPTDVTVLTCMLVDGLP